MPRIARSPRATGLPIAELQLASLVDAPPDGPQWIHEQKFDGYRIVADKSGARVRLLSRRFKDWTTEFPTITEAIASLPCRRAALDGEVCVVLPDGRTSFQALQNAVGTRDPRLCYFAFDLLAVDGESLMSLPLEQRKSRLAELIAGAPRLRYSDHVVGGGAQFLALACEAGLEGIVSKRKDQRYTPGRGKGWLKTKCLLRQELVIGGFTDPEGSRSGIGSLLTGYYEDGRLVYAGKVGTGYSMKMLADLRRMLEPLERSECPFDPIPPRAWTGPARHWVPPRFVAEVAFSEWTDEGRLRHPSFQGLRDDKSPRDVVRERPVVDAGDRG